MSLDGTDYVICGWLSDGLARTYHVKYGRNLWATVVLRKAKQCIVCDAPMAVKSTVFSPITNGYNRMHRICLTCMHRMPAQ